MPTSVLTTALRALGAVVLVAGLLVAGVGAVETARHPCSNAGVDYLDTYQVDDPPADARVVAYENQSEDNRTVFRRVLNGTETRAEGQQGLTRVVVEYRGERYAFVTYHADCVNAGRAYLFFGGASVLLGGAVAGVGVLFGRD